MPNNNPSKLASLRKPNYKGSWWKEYYKTRTTMSFGNFTPVHLQEIPANTLFKVKPEIRFESLPMLSPLYDGFTMRTKFYAYPIRLAIPELFKNKQQPWGSIPNFKFPTMTFNNDYSPESEGTNSQYGLVSLAGSLLDMLGMAYGAINVNQSFNNPAYHVNFVAYNSADRINLLPLIAYLECWMRGEYNPQDKYIPVLNEIINTANSNVQRMGYYSYLDSNEINNFINAVRGFGIDESGTSIFLPHYTDNELGGSIGFDVYPTDGTQYAHNSFLMSQYPLFTVIGTSNDILNESFVPLTGTNLGSFFGSEWSNLRNMTSNVGLLPVTYKGDYLSSWYNEEGINRLESYSISNGEGFLSLRQKNADFMIDLLSIISGNRGTDYLQFVFDSYLELKDHPILVGWDEIHFGANEDTTSTANTGDGANGILGAVSSKARDYSNKVKPISFKTQEPCLLMVCSSIIPNVVYSQGVDRFMLKTTYSDLWHPQYDSRGFQRINPDEYYNPYALGAHSVENGYDVYEEAVAENYVAPFVPLGWEYMQHKSTLKGGIKTDRYKTWSLNRDFSYIGVENTRSQTFDTFSQLTVINPLSGALYTGGSLVSGGTDNSYQNLGNWLNSLTSTYVRGVPYNLPFANVDAFDSQNFVVNYGFIVSQYMPITHNLITKTF